MQGLDSSRQSNIKCIPQTLEKYISFSIGSLRVIDSFQFLPSSLETLVDSLVKSDDTSFHFTMKAFPEEELLKLILRKGVYPYDYMDSEDRFAETQLPPKEEFYSKIKNEHISDADYLHPQKVFEVFHLNDLGEYHDLYLKTDVLLLCDVFEQFRNVSMLQYSLDPAHYYTSPSLAWSACLKKICVTLELMCDIDQINFIENGLRGGISQISNRYQSANNPYLGEELYDASKPTTYLQYLDMNNLYGYAMVQKLPTGLFKFLTDEEIKSLDFQSVAADSSTGYILEVSLSYPKEIHESYSYYPLAPERKCILNEELSPYAKSLWKRLHRKKDVDLPPRSSVPKLITSLNDKDNYIVHYRTLQLYLQLGMKIKSILRVLSSEYLNSSKKRGWSPI